MNLPVDFIQRMRHLLGESGWELWQQAFEAEAPASIRVNREKTGNLMLSDDKIEQVAWCAEGYYLKSRPSFTFDPLFHAGCYYVQEASSMFLARVLRQFVTEPVRMLDLCAAPGGKSTLARTCLPEGSLLVANEVMRNRAQILAENLMKWGHPDTVVTCDDPADFATLPHFFDVMLTDVPCSGEGMFRKDEEAIADWSEENVAVCWKRQRRILADVWPSLKPGGLLVYSTCTFNVEENELNVEWIANELGADVLKVETEPEWNITGNLAGKDFPVYRFLPHRTKGEGLFMAVLRKHEEDWNEQSRKKSKKKQPADKVQIPKVVKEWLASEASLDYKQFGNLIVAAHSCFQEEMSLLSQSLKVVYGGIPVGEVKGKDVVPHHALAMSTALNRNAFPHVELTYEQAIAYLRKEAIVLESTAPKGMVLVTYRDCPLGFVKNIGNRANNLYPNEWRIRSGVVPTVETSLFL